MKNETNKKFFVQMAAMIVTLIVAVLAVFGIGYSTGLFSDVSEVDVGGGGATISSGESNGITLTSETLGATNSTAESTHTLTATISPSYATNPTLSWSIAWDTSWSGYTATSGEDVEDVYGDGWVTGDYMSDSSFLANYVSLSATTGSSVTVSCWQPFGNPIIITVATTDGSNLKSTCKVDYQSYYTSLSITDCSSVVMSSSGSSTVNVSFYPDYSIGTIVASGTLSYSCGVGTTTYTSGSTYTTRTTDYLANYIDGSYDGYSGYTNSDAWLYSFSSSNSGSISGTSSGTIFSFSKNWTTFVQELIDGNSYITGNTVGYTYSQYGASALSDFYCAVAYCGIENFHPFTFSGTLVDSKTGTTYTASTNFTFSTLSTFPTYAVTSLSIPSSITF